MYRKFSIIEEVYYTSDKVQVTLNDRHSAVHSGSLPADILPSLKRSSWTARHIVVRVYPGA